MRNSAQIGAQPLHGCLRNGRAKIRRQLTLANLFNRGKHVRWAAPGQIADHEFGRDRNPCAREFVCGHFGSDLFAIDQHTVAIKDDHREPLISALRGARRPDMLLDESELKKLGIAAVAKVGRCAARKSFLHSLLIAGPNLPRKGPNSAWP
jgi:hypothetical protein